MTATLQANAYRADHVGSFLRPPELLELRAKSPHSDALRACEDAAILRVLAKQRELGFAIFTDGELRRGGFMSDLFDAVEGFEGGDAHVRHWEGATGIDPQAIREVVTGKLRQRQRMTAAELPFLREHSPGPIKMTLPSANQFPAIAYRKGISEQAYPTYAEFLTDVGTIVAGEMKALAADGVAYIQLDAPRYSYYLDAKWRAFLQTEYNRDLDALLTEAIAIDNRGFRAARAPGVVLAIHLCRGNNRSNWYASGGYDAIAEQLFTQLEVDRFLLEYDDERSGTFEPLRFVPANKTVVLGLVSTKVGRLEHPDALARLIDQATKYVPLDRLALSPQCGFASMAAGNVITEEEQWIKMKLVVDVAKRVWG